MCPRLPSKKKSLKTRRKLHKSWKKTFTRDGQEVPQKEGTFTLTKSHLVRALLKTPRIKKEGEVIRM